MSDTTNNTTKMLQAILSGQNALKQELVSKIDKVDQRLSKVEKNLEEKIDRVDQKLTKVERNLTKRIDGIGLHLASLDDDTPSREEHDELEKRVEKLEQKATFAA